MYVPPCPAHHIAPLRRARRRAGQTIILPACPLACLPALWPACPYACARILDFLWFYFFFNPFPRLALNQYQLHLSWDRWLKTASAYVQGPQGLAGQDPR